MAKAGKWPRALDQPPEDLRRFLHLCDALHELKDERDQNYLPIATSNYPCHTMWGQILEPLTGKFRALEAPGDPLLPGAMAETVAAIAARRINIFR